MPRLRKGCKTWAGSSCCSCQHWEHTDEGHRTAERTLYELWCNQPSLLLSSVWVAAAPQLLNQKIPGQGLPRGCPRTPQPHAPQSHSGAAPRQATGRDRHGDLIFEAFWPGQQLAAALHGPMLAAKSFRPQHFPSEPQQSQRGSSTRCQNRLVPKDRRGKVENRFVSHLSAPFRLSLHFLPAHNGLGFCKQSLRFWGDAWLGRRDPEPREGQHAAQLLVQLLLRASEHGTEVGKPPAEQGGSTGRGRGSSRNRDHPPQHKPMTPLQTQGSLLAAGCILLSASCPIWPPTPTLPRGSSARGAAKRAGHTRGWLWEAGTGAGPPLRRVTKALLAPPGCDPA